MMKQCFCGLLAILSNIASFGQPTGISYNDYTRSFFVIDTPFIALRQVKLLDGTGGPAQVAQTLLLEKEIIKAVGPMDSIPIPEGYQVIDLEGHTVIPGLVGTHNHLRLPNSAMLSTGPRLYLAAGVTTIQTCGTGNPKEEIAIANNIDDGRQPGPQIIHSSPYFTGPDGKANFIRFTTEKEIRDTITYWVKQGVEWFKVYRNTRPSDLAIIIDQAHRLGAKVTGHLCATTYQEAATLGIDAIEHGFLHSFDHAAGKELNSCSGSSHFRSTIELASPEVKKVQQTLIEHQVALSTTPSIFATQAEMDADERDLAALAPEHVTAYQQSRQRKQVQGQDWYFKPEWVGRSLAYDLQFFRAGGLLTAGPDPGIYNLPGYGDQKNYELLVKAGFSPAEAIQVLTSNGAKSLELPKVGKVAVGMQADLVVLKGDLEADARVIRAVQLVIRGGKVYDPVQLLQGIPGNVGSRYDDSMHYFGQRPPGMKAEIFAPGIISRKDRYEFGSVFSKAGDEFYFGVDEGHRVRIYYSTLANGVWSPAQLFLPDDVAQHNDPMFSPDEQRLYFISTRSHDKNAKKEDADIWYVERTTDGWSTPLPLGENINTPANEYYISFDQKGNLYFASNVKAEEGKSHNYDIYRARLQDGKFSSPTPLSSTINSERYEVDVFAAPDESYLIFCAIRREGFGRGDLYISFKTAEGWSQAQNMGPKINNEGHQLCPFVSRDGKYLFFTSDQDIYWIDAAIIDTFKP